MTDTAAPQTSRPPFFGDLEHELATTRRLLERVPDEHWDWSPHAKSMTLGRLASHLAELPHLGVAVLTRDAFDAATDRPQRTGPSNRAELLQGFDQAAAALTAALDSVPADGWRQNWELKNAGQVFLSLPRAGALRVLAISHPIHHRGQLSVYLRLLDVPVPSIYGPSADEAPNR